MLIRFWPVIIPLAVYLLWRWWRLRRARKYGYDEPQWTRSHGYFLLIASLLVAVGCMLFFGLTAERNHGAYIPAMERDGELVPGHME